MFIDGAWSVCGTPYIMINIMKSKTYIYFKYFACVCVYNFNRILLPVLAVNTVNIETQLCCVWLQIKTKVLKVLKKNVRF